MLTEEIRQGGSLHDPKLEHEPILLSVPQTVSLLGIGATLTWELMHSGAIPTIKLGRRVLVPRGALEQLARRGISPLPVHPNGHHMATS